MEVGLAEAPVLAHELAKRQNSDGGWSYTNKGSWTEPTTLALLALNTTGAFYTERARAEAWLCAQQRDDGGWPPREGVMQSTWVTAAVLLVPEMQNCGGHGRAIEWLMNRTGRESTFVERLRRLLLGAHIEVGEGTVGWPWFPNTAGWVTPTAYSMLALRKVANAWPEVSNRLAEGRQFLLARTCADGGWNHGASKALGYSATSYPDTTGQALLALSGVTDRRVEAAIDLAENQLRKLRSVEAASWLQLGLLAHGRNAVEPQAPVMCRTTIAFAVKLLATGASNNNALL